ncbi:MAG: thiamine phosphate synthase [Bacteroidales bacterium]|nr:thiamine phosphate synthase [Bacteroidales bacterium]
MYISKFQYITHENTLYSHAKQSALVCEAGCKWVQVRVKEKPRHEVEAICKETLEVCRNYQSTVIINDNVQLAKELQADGVHLGKNDMPVDEARNILGDNYIIGGTANTIDDIIRLNKQNVDYIGLGPFRYTNTKKNLSPILGFQGYKDIFKNVKQLGISTPIVAIGGIMSNDIEEVLKTKVHGIAVSSAIFRSDNPKLEAMEFCKIETEENKI